MEQECSKNNQNSYPPYKYDSKKLNLPLSVVKADGIHETFDIKYAYRTIAWASSRYETLININLILQESINNIFDGITSSKIDDAHILAAATFIEKDPAYGYVAARLLFKKLFKEVTDQSALGKNTPALYRKSFVNGIMQGTKNNILDKRMLNFDLEYLAQNLDLERDNLLYYMGMRTLYERYFIKNNNKRTELPQSFWMRIAMGLSYNESDKNKKAMLFYNIMSTLRYVPSTPTLLHAGLVRPQLSSCFLTTVKDNLHHIFKSYSDNAQLAKWSGGIANDFSNVRATGAIIDSIKTESQGTIPFIKIVNDVTAAINRSGKRRGATCVYLETWHLDIEDFIDLRKNTGDERRRTHDINTAHWIPDLFMKRVIDDKSWTLFSPDEVPDLHDLYGKDFEKKYIVYEEKAQKGKLNLYKTVSAKQLWRKMLSRLFETGHPWVTFKDPCNIRSPQDHVGVIHSSNLCTEITLNTSHEEIAVCNLGSINLEKHIDKGKIDNEKIAETTTIAIDMLDRVIDITFYPVEEAKVSNNRHRPIGLGMMGLQDALFKCNINFNSEGARTFADEITETIAYHAILASSKLAKERGKYSSFHGSKWDRNIFPQDSITLLEKERGTIIPIKKTGRLDWTPVRKHVKEHGMRNSNTMAIAPTATISNICNVFPSIEPLYKNIYGKVNMSGEFTVINHYLIEDLKALRLWNQETLDQLKYYDGNINMINCIPQYIKEKYVSSFDIDQIWLIKISAARGKWIDQSQSHNIFMSGLSGTLLSNIFITAWKLGLKTLYYLRTLASSQIEKSTLDAKKFGFTQKREYVNLHSVEKATENNNGNKQAICEVPESQDCEVCQ